MNYTEKEHELAFRGEGNACPSVRLLKEKLENTYTLT